MILTLSPHRKPALQAVEHGFALGDGTVRSLPGLRPAAAQRADVVGLRTHYEDLRTRLEGEGSIVLEQRERLLDSFAGNGRVSVLVHGAVGQGVFPQTQLGLDRKDAGHRVVDASHRHLARLDHGDEVGDDMEPIVVGHHDHVDARVDGGGDLFAGIARNQFDGAPVADDEAVEPFLVLQPARQQVLVGGAFSRR